MASISAVIKFLVSTVSSIEPSSFNALVISSNTWAATLGNILSSSVWDLASPKTTPACSLRLLRNSVEVCCWRPRLRFNDIKRIELKICKRNPNGLKNWTTWIFRIYSTWTALIFCRKSWKRCSSTANVCNINTLIDFIIFRIETVRLTSGHGQLSSHFNNSINESTKTEEIILRSVVVLWEADEVSVEGSLRFLWSHSRVFRKPSKTEYLNFHTV